MNTTPRTVECTIPVLRVSDLGRSLEFYTQALGFAEDWRTEGMASVSRDGCSIMLSAIEPIGAVGWVWIGLEDDSLFEIWRGRGVQVVQEPKNYSWAWEMKFADPDGNVLWLGTEPRSDLPLEDRA
jgi:catechol 2,3-dioxygenase-like lactoylglutathione lyase family enzyme